MTIKKCENALKAQYYKNNELCFSKPQFFLFYKYDFEWSTTTQIQAVQFLKALTGVTGNPDVQIHPKNIREWPIKQEMVPLHIAQIGF